MPNKQIGVLTIGWDCATWTLKGLSTLDPFDPSYIDPGFESPSFSIFGNEFFLYLMDFRGPDRSQCSVGLRYLGSYSNRGINTAIMQCEMAILRNDEMVSRSEPKGFSSQEWQRWNDAIKFNELRELYGPDINRVRVHVKFWISVNPESIYWTHINQDNGTPTEKIEDVSERPTVDYLSLAFKSWHNNRVCTDMTVQVGNQQFEIHRFVFASRSKVFYRMFSQDMSESETRKIIIPDLDAEVFDQLVEYMYTGDIEGLTDPVSDLLYAAEKYELDGLKGLIAKTIAKTISKSTALDSLLMAEAYRAQELKDVVQSFLKRQGSEVTFWDDWMDFLTKRPSLANEVLRFILPPKTSNATGNPLSSKVRKE